MGSNPRAGSIPASAIELRRRDALPAVSADDLEFFHLADCLRSVSQRQDFDFVDADLAAGIVLLKGEVSLLERLREIQIFV